jgi:CDP-diacylglycerol--serine O-phosphatidyltransferase
MEGLAEKRYIVAMAMNQPGFERPRRAGLGPRLRRRRFRSIPVRVLVPNVITLLALCAGLTAIRMASEGNYTFALYAIVFAAILDGIDGRLARFLKGTSRFGAELDSLADFVNFGVAPALIIYFWGLHDLKSAGWIAAMAFAICAGLRLARFNVMLDDPDRPAWASNFFVGMPAPAGAITLLLPIYASFLGLPHELWLTWMTLLYTLGIASLMVSRLFPASASARGSRPRWSGGSFLLLFSSLPFLSPIRGNCSRPGRSPIWRACRLDGCRIANMNEDRARTGLKRRRSPRNLLRLRRALRSRLTGKIVLRASIS